MKTYVALALAILTQAVGNVCLSKGMKELPSADAIDVHALLALFSQAIQSPILWVGTALLIAFFLLFAAVLSWADLTFVLPVISAEVIVNVAFANYFLNEPVSSSRWAGTILISIGVILVLRSRKMSAGTGGESER